MVEYTWGSGPHNILGGLHAPNWLLIGVGLFGLFVAIRIIGSFVRR